MLRASADDYLHNHRGLYTLSAAKALQHNETADGYAGRYRPRHIVPRIPSKIVILPIGHFQ